ncbi:MAG TPA: glucose 1-dehydrogenase [Terriglobia bacterium]|nr:glucose 1-dehydrogenase [Terriglobia bacterium]
MRLKEKVAVVTGGATGIGRAISIFFAREGAHLAIADIDASNGVCTSAEINSTGGKSSFILTDVSKAQDVQEMVETVAERYGGIDIAVNSAAIQMHGLDAPAHLLPEEVWDRTMNINMRGVWLCSKFVIPEMLKRGGGSIIHLASPTGITGCAPTYTAYSTSKGGVIALTRIMAVDYARNHIRVNAIVPGTTETPMIAALLKDEEVRGRLIAKSPLGRLGTPEDVASLAVFLASDESSYCTGGLYRVEGGMLVA